MALACPSFFDEYDRIRTRSSPFDPSYNFAQILEQMTGTLQEQGFVAISPQNVVHPAELVRAIIVRRGRTLVPMIDPRIVTISEDYRWQLQGCGNIFLVDADGHKVTLGVLTSRPRWAEITYLDENHTRKTRRFRDSAVHSSSCHADFLGYAVHEMDHMSGLLIVDHAGERLRRALEVTRRVMEENPGSKDDIVAYQATRLPVVLEYAGDRYVFHAGTEFLNRDVPLATPDILYFDSVMNGISSLALLYVPRANERIPIEPSPFARSFFK